MIQFISSAEHDISSCENIIMFESQVIANVIMASRLNVRANIVLLKFENSKKDLRISAHENFWIGPIFTFFCDKI